jgi:glucose-6-phosphate 1-dehydrogenase
MKHTTDPAAIVILGASGDLTQRKLVPALHSLMCDRLLHPGTRVIGVARTPMSDEEFRDRLYQGVVEYARLKPKMLSLWQEFVTRVSYMPGGYDDPQTYRRLGARLDQPEVQDATHSNRLFYLAVPPDLYPKIVDQLGAAGLSHRNAGWARIIIEKPFGQDSETARRLNKQVHAVFDEAQLYRIDHYLGKETVQNLMTFRFANAIFEPLWNRNYVDHVEISALETVGVEHRAGYYDQTGIVRDMFQNHMLQLLTLTTMEPPPAFNAQALRDEKAKVLQAVRPLSPANGVWGQYQGYCDENGVAPDSQTPTFLALKLFVDNWRWQGVPFYLRSGKKLAKKATEITLEFKPVPHQLFPEEAGLVTNSLSLCIQPDEGMHLKFETKVPGAGMRAEPVDMDFHYSDHFGQQALPEAYERLLLDAIQGDASLFSRGDEIELAWDLVGPLIDSTVGGREPALYAPESWGPPAADALLAQEGRSWRIGCTCAHDEE